MANDRHEVFYPPVVVGALRAMLTIKDQMGSHKYIENSPYPEAVQKMLKDLFSGVSNHHFNNPDVPEMPLLTEDDIKNLDAEKEVATLYLKMRNFEIAATGLEATERLAVFRVSTSLMEKLITLKEKAADLKLYGKFKDVVISAVTKYLTQEELSEFMGVIAAHSQSKKS